VSPRANPDFLTELFRQPLDPGYAEAARRRAEGPPPAPWRVRSERFGRLLVFALIGFLLTVAYQYAVAAKPDTSKARAGLVSDVKARRAQTDDLQRQADELREQVVKQRDAALGDGGDQGRRLRDLEAATGLASVHGDGVVVRLADAAPQVDPVTGKQSGTNLGVVLDRDLQDIANELWRDGAEAVAVNDQRLAGTSTIRAAGGAILVDFRPVTGPYRVAAIGPSDLDKRFTESATAHRFGRYVDLYGMQFSVKGQRGLTLPAAPEPQLRYARAPDAAPSGSPVPSASGGGK
jgi:uncharacterized protein YlxW (UPF0749 family)